MGQVHVQVMLTNYREALLARRGQVKASQVHRYEAVALIDTRTVQSVVPAAVADRLGLMRLRRTCARYADGRVEAVDVAEVVTIEILGRQIEVTPLVLGQDIVLGVMVLEGLDLMVDCRRERLVPWQGTLEQPVFCV